MRACPFVDEPDLDVFVCVCVCVCHQFIVLCVRHGRRREERTEVQQAITETDRELARNRVQFVSVRKETTTTPRARDYPFSSAEAGKKMFHPLRGLSAGRRYGTGSTSSRTRSRCSRISSRRRLTSRCDRVWGKQPHFREIHGNCAICINSSKFSR